MEPIHTERLLIRRATAADEGDYLRFRTRPEVQHYIGGVPLSAERAAMLLARQDAINTETGEDCYIMFAVTVRGENRMIGESGLFITAPPKNEGDIGWIIHPDYQGRGYAPEAARALLDYGFRTRCLRRITSSCDARNTRSVRVMEHLGMRREAHFRQASFAHGVWHDEYRYALLRDEWLDGVGQPDGV